MRCFRPCLSEAQWCRSTAEPLGHPNRCLRSTRSSGIAAAMTTSASLHHTKAQLHRRGDLERRPGRFAVSLSEVAVAGREQRARVRRPATSGRFLLELLDVDVAADLPWWRGAQPIGRRRVRPTGSPSAALGSMTPKPLGASRASRRVIVGSRSSDGATPITPRNGSPRIAMPGISGRPRVAVRDLPVDNRRLELVVGEHPETRTGPDQT